MESAVPWQRFEPSKCHLGSRQQNRKYVSAEYIPVSYKDSMMEMPSLQIITPWLSRPSSFSFGEVSEMGWVVSDHPFFQKLKIFHEQMRQHLQTHHHVKLNANQNLLSGYYERSRGPVQNLTTGTTIDLQDAILYGSQQYKLCIRLAGIHLQHGNASYRFKCVGLVVRQP